MDRDAFIGHVSRTYDEGVALIRRKNADYATGPDPFHNFRACEVIGVPAEVGICVRLMDKMSRIGNGLKGEFQVSDETLDDTILDAINYLAILRALIHSRRLNEAGQR